MPSANGGEKVYNTPRAARKDTAVRRRGSGETWELIVNQILVRQNE